MMFPIIATVLWSRTLSSLRPLPLTRGVRIGVVTIVHCNEFVVLVLALAAASAAPQSRNQGQINPNPNNEVQIIRYEVDNDGVGNYNFALEQSDGTRRDEQGELKNPGTDDEAISVRGSYSWVGPDGVTYLVTYIADENGFQPTIQKSSRR